MDCRAKDTNIHSTRIYIRTKRFVWLTANISTFCSSRRHWSTKNWRDANLGSSRFTRYGHPVWTTYSRELARFHCLLPPPQGVLKRRTCNIYIYKYIYFWRHTFLANIQGRGWLKHEKAVCHTAQCQQIRWLCSPKTWALAWDMLSHYELGCLAYSTLTIHVVYSINIVI